MLVELTRDELLKIVRVCLTDTNLLRMSILGVVLDYPTKEYHECRRELTQPTQVDILIRMLETGKRVYFIDQFNGANHEFDISLEYAEQRFKGYEVLSATSNILAGGHTEEDSLIALQYIIYGRYKYPLL